MPPHERKIIGSGALARARYLRMPDAAALPAWIRRRAGGAGSDEGVGSVTPGACRAGSAGRGRAVHATRCRSVACLRGKPVLAAWKPPFVFCLRILVSGGGAGNMNLI
ncbi:hypothetical protein CBM2589_A20091 [Cupriavidus taiwanensis]|uniref:Uncharacterized protein n=1 Tax=Cupriavidus taiwanensis TaxID=164546 RepID=A0A375C072_9BURK|nr:hypothetical protein CBM2589_A20091 [Cupriavidus taiwanensis]